MKTLTDSELAQVIEALGGACEEISKWVASKGGRGDEIHPDAPDDDAFADTVRAFEACDEAYELLTGHLYGMTADGEVTGDYLVVRRVKAWTTEARGDMGLRDLQVDDLERFTELAREDARWPTCRRARKQQGGPLQDGP
jgi:hypothetical protein